MFKTTQQFQLDSVWLWRSVRMKVDTLNSKDNKNHCFLKQAGFPQRLFQLYVIFLVCLLSKYLFFLYSFEQHNILFMLYWTFSLFASIFVLIDSIKHNSPAIEQSTVTLEG